MTSRSFAAVAATLSVCLLAACTGPVTKQISLDPDGPASTVDIRSGDILTAIGVEWL